MESVDLASLTAAAQNGAWASGDPEHMATYGLMAEYALGSAVDEMEAAEAAAEVAADLAEDAAEAAGEDDDD